MPRAVLVLALVLALAAPAGAGTSLAGPLVAEQLRCCALNAGPRPAQVVIRIFDAAGADVTGSDLCELDLPIAPGGACCAQASLAAPTAAHCVIRTDRPKRELRGSLAAEAAAGEPVSVLEAR